MVLANPINNTYGVYALFLAGKSPHITYTVIHIAYIRFWPTLDTALTTTHTHTHHTHTHTHVRAHAPVPKGGQYRPCLKTETKQRCLCLLWPAWTRQG